MWQLPENKNNLPCFAHLFAFLYFMQLFQISSNIILDQFKHRGQKQLPKKTAQDIDICSFYILNCCYVKPHFSWSVSGKLPVMESLSSSIVYVDQTTKSYMGSWAKSMWKNLLPQAFTAYNVHLVWMPTRNALQENSTKQPSATFVNTHFKFVNILW